MINYSRTMIRTVIDYQPSLLFLYLMLGLKIVVLDCTSSLQKRNKQTNKQTNKQKTMVYGVDVYSERKVLLIVCPNATLWPLGNRN